MGIGFSLFCIESKHRQTLAAVLPHQENGTQLYCSTHKWNSGFQRSCFVHEGSISLSPMPKLVELELKGRDFAGWNLPLPVNCLNPLRSISLSPIPLPTSHPPAKASGTSKPSGHGCTIRCIGWYVGAAKPPPGEAEAVFLRLRDRTFSSGKPSHGCGSKTGTNMEPREVETWTKPCGLPLQFNLSHTHTCIAWVS